MRYARFASFAAGVVTAFVVDIAVTETVSRWILSPLFVGIPAVAVGILVTAVTTWF